MSLEPCFERSNGLRNPHLNPISDAGNFWPWKCLKSTAACQGHAATGPQHDFIFKHWRFKRRHRVIFKSLIHDCPCSRQTRTRSRNSYTKSKERPTNQPTNKQTGFDLSISFTNWPSIQATANDLKIPQKPVALSENDLCDSLIDSSNLPPTSGRTKKLAPSNLFTAAKASSREYRCTGEKA